MVGRSRSDSAKGSGAAKGGNAESAGNAGSPIDERHLRVVGRVTGVYGIKGWVKLQSYTDPVTNLLNMEPCYLKTPRGWQEFEFDEGKAHGKGLIVHPLGCNNRNDAELISKAELAVPDDAFVALEEGDYYWYELENLAVWTVDAAGAPAQLLGHVDHLLETGSNDVLVVTPDAQSIDTRERLIPYRPGPVVKKVDLVARQILVDWDTDF